ncbi:MAG: hypothetical protein DRP01_00205 [Archaeoglobales archaeon]|nr:MAG: hypothetical protein DRP01_00205 [Archaeoglobales archaeon]
MVKTCETCGHFWPLVKGLRGGKVKQLKQAYCLALTVFPSNRVGKHVYPPGAKIKDTPNAMIQAKIVRTDQIVPNCAHRKDQ